MINKLVSKLKDGPLSAIGLGLLAASAWTWDDSSPGLAATGLAILLFEWRLEK